MHRLMRHAMLLVTLWLLLTGVCHGRPVYLKDGGIIEAQSAWQRGDTVFVKVNRDILEDFAASDIDLRRTFPRTVRPVRTRHRLPTMGATKAFAEPAPAAPAVTVAAPVPKPAAAPAPLAQAAEPAPAAAAPLDKAELQRRQQEAAKMMAQALMTKDTELMKKALELQKSTLPQQGAGAPHNAGIPLYVPLMILVACILMIAAQWVIFQRAGRAGWISLVPFYNMYVLMEVAGKPGWWMFLLLIPVVNIVFFLLAMLSLAKKFRRNELFGVGITLLPMIFMPVLAFGGSEYEG